MKAILSTLILLTLVVLSEASHLTQTSYEQQDYVGCTEDADCLRDEACYNKECKLTCRDSSECSAGEYCFESPTVCLEACKSDADCLDGLKCIEDECKSKGSNGECTSNRDCAESEICQDKSCVEGGGQTCVNSRDCKNGEVCKAGLCTASDGEDNSCFDIEDCKNGEVCQQGVCTADGNGGEETCVDSKDCTNEEICEEGLCTFSGCRSDDDCPQDQTCADKVCVIECETSEECLQTERCENNICVTTVFACEVTDDCIDTEECIDQKCTKPMPSGSNSIMGDFKCQSEIYTKGNGQKACLAALPQKMSYFDAKTACAAMGAYLPQPKQLDDTIFLASFRATQGKSTSWLGAQTYHGYPAWMTDVSTSGEVGYNEFPRFEHPLYKFPYKYTTADFYPPNTCYMMEPLPPYNWVYTPCVNPLDVICEKLAPKENTLIGPNECIDAPLTPFTKSDGRKYCLIKIRDRMFWDFNQNACRALGIQMVTMDNAVDESRVKALYVPMAIQALTLGIKRQSGQWRYVPPKSGVVTYLNWQVGNNFQDVYKIPKECVTVPLEGPWKPEWCGDWLLLDTIACEEPLPRPPGKPLRRIHVCPNVPYEPYVKASGELACTILTNEHIRPYADAQEHCRFMGQNIITIGSSEENLEVARRVAATATDRAWIGLTNQGTGGCSIIHSLLSQADFGKWSNVGCDGFHRTICELILKM